MSFLNFSAILLFPEATILDGITPKSSGNSSEGDSEHVHVARCYQKMRERVGSGALSGWAAGLTDSSLAGRRDKSEP